MERLNLDDHDDLLRLYNRPLLEKKAIQTLHGMAAAWVYDGVIQEDEAVAAVDWMRSNLEFANVWPVSELYELVMRIVDDGVISAAERDELFKFLVSVAASPASQGLAADGLFDPCPGLVFDSRQFLFTGKLQMGTRKRAQGAVTQRGGIVAKSPVISLDYLVVGDLGTAQWKYSRYGTKIEKVKKNQGRGASTIIVNERTFVAAVIGA